MRGLVLVQRCTKLVVAILLLIASNFSYNCLYAQAMPVAVDDRYLMLIDCNNNVLVGNLLDNDMSEKAANIEIAYVVAPAIGLFSCGPNGNFIYIVQERFDGIVEFRYRIWNKENNDLYSDATVKIAIRQDSDCDHVYDLIDIDCDNDGILNIYEGSGETDTDGDGIPDSFDIDSDNDGITDLEEWQSEENHILPLMQDENNDGWDDAFDSEYGGDYYEPVDTDSDGTPDYLDSDSDDDSISDFLEALDTSSRSLGYELSGIDCDFDGLDDFADTIDCCAYQTFTVCSSSALPDSNEDNIRDWRDPNNSIKPKNSQDIKGLEDAFVYPNPVKGTCTVVLENIDIGIDENIEIRLYSESGKLLQQKLKQKSTFELNLNELPQGAYLFRADINSRAFRATIIKN